MRNFLAGPKKYSHTEEKAIYDRCFKTLFNTALRIVGNNCEAEEVMHDTLLKFFGTSQNFESNADSDRWMTRVCVNLSIDRLRAKKRLREETNQNIENIGSAAVLFDPAETEHVENPSIRGIRIENVREALTGLANGYRTILTLILFEGYDFQEVAQITKIKEVTVRSQYMRGKEKLIMQIQKQKKDSIKK